MAKLNSKVEGFGDYDVIGAIMDFESGMLATCEIVELFQHLVDTGMAWNLDGSYGRAAERLIERGLIKRPK